MFKNIITLNIQETGYHVLEKNRLLVLGYEIHTHNGSEKKSWVIKNFEDEHAALQEFRDFLQSLNLQTTLLVTYDGREYDIKIMITRAMIHTLDLSELLSFQHIDIFDFLKKNTRLGATNIFDVASILQCGSVSNEKIKNDLKMTSASVLAVEGKWKALVEYNNTMLSVIYEVFLRTRNYIFPEFKVDLLDSVPSQEEMFG
jgi:DNA polymerase elongation subunit (family B)